MGGLVEEPVFRVLKALERLDPGASIFGSMGKLAERIEKIHGVGTAIGIRTELARTRWVRARPAGVCSRVSQSVPGDE
jgi:hypothetical protein